MPAVRLGKLVLRWCKTCNLPILNSKTCSICDVVTQPVIHTPPGDIRPAFNFDIELIKNMIDTQFGTGCGDKFIPENGLIILNRAPDLDRLDEVIFDGVVQGALKFDLFQQRFRFLPRIIGAERFLECISKGYVVVDHGAVKPILSGSNALAPGIVKVSEGIQKGDELLVLTQKHALLGAGSAYMSSSEMLNTDHGLAVKIRWHADFEHFTKQKKNGSIVTSRKIGMDSNNIREVWDLAIKANKPELDKIVKDATEFIDSTIKQNNLPIAVSFSGGKDSLATLLLVLETGIKPKLFFIDTGLEFPETVEHVKDIAEKFDLDLITGKPSNTFWDGLAYFGPPGKDYRWCCKTCKLGPTTRQIKHFFPSGVLMFIGQRRYESIQRSQKKMIWHNPWVPGQIGASPIQHWSALHIWMYLFRSGVEFNSLYGQGLERIGCWLCPASDLADLKSVSELHPDYSRWQKFLIDYSKSRNFSSFWLEAELWRWKKLPKGIKKLLLEKKIPLIDRHAKKAESIDNDLISTDSELALDKPLQLKLAEGFTDCKFGLSQEGVFNKELDIVRVANLANIVGKVKYDEADGYCTINELIDIFPEGAIVVKGKSQKEIKNRVSKTNAVVFRALECLGCGICIGRCENEALILDKSTNLEQVKIIEDRCTHCGECLGPCPVVNFNESQFFEM